MTSGLDDTVERDLDALRRDYEGTLARRIAEIVAGWEAVTRASDQTAARQTVLQLAHCLAGTAGVLGLAEVSRAAAKLEDALEQASPAAEQAEKAQRIALALEQLVRTAAAADVCHRSSSL